MTQRSTKGVVSAVLLLGVLFYGASAAQAAPTCKSPDLDQIYAALARAQAATAAGQQPLAHQQLALAGRCTLGPAYKGVQGNLKRLQQQSRVRPAEIQGVLGLLANAEALSKGQKPSRWLALSSALALSTGPLETGGHILALLLALLVLWLMWRGFVQGQRFQAQRGRSLWWGLLLLLLPTLTQGLLTLLGTVGSALHLQPLASLLGVASSAGWWPLFTLFSVLGLGGLAYVLYHICAQFGLFGTLRRPTLTPLESQPGWDLE